MNLTRRSGSSASSASKMRSEPDWWPLPVMTARPPDFSTAVCTASESVATTASPIWASCARRSTWTIIGIPPISAKGLPGRRVEAMRAGIKSGSGTWMLWPSAPPARKFRRVLTNVVPSDCRYRAAYTGCQRPGKPVSVRRCRALGGDPTRAATRPFREPYFDEFFRTQQSPRRHPGDVPDRSGAQYRCRRHFRPREAGQAGLHDRRQDVWR